MRWLSAASSDAELRTKSIFRLNILTDNERSRGKREREEIQGRAYGLDTCAVCASATPGMWFSINGKRFGGDTHILEEVIKAISLFKLFRLVFHMNMKAHSVLTHRN